ncbi:DUF7384 family protein [Halalkalirubrum salinum]|uniref:DUF7384 family protein n=1 Tax=Halalkalirubrum salinum TaxID=2563889 RepID=UPI001F10FA62|nr:hypothetical protein [Halalkalirubrum salinum]
MSWTALFDRARSHDATIETISSVVNGRRDAPSSAEPAQQADTPQEPSPAAIVVDADVWAADLFGVDEAATTAIDQLWQHTWIDVIASDALLADAVAVIDAVVDASDDDTATATDVSDESQTSPSAAWRSTLDAWRRRVTHPAGDHPALGSAYRGGAMHVLSYDDRLTGAGAAAALNDRFPISIREPAAFAAVFNAESLFGSVHEVPYEGPDRPPRSSEAV